VPVLRQVASAGFREAANPFKRLTAFFFLDEVCISKGLTQPLLPFSFWVLVWVGLQDFAKSFLFRESDRLSFAPGYFHDGA
jgi:hypothetical protein